MAFPVFRHLPLIHAITTGERDNLARLFPGQRLEIIPNAVNLAEIDGALAVEAPDSSVKAEGRYLLFLGSIAPQKGDRLVN